MAIEIVDLPINSMVDLSIVFCKRLPEGNQWLMWQFMCNLKRSTRVPRSGYPGAVSWIGTTYSWLGNPRTELNKWRF